MKQQDQPQQPFFVNFLESQQGEERQNNATTKPWIDGDQTHKYPSDNDDNPPDTF